MSVGVSVIKNNLTREQFDELLRASKDVFYFFTLLFVIHPMRGKTQFDLYPFQKRVLWYFLTERFNIILKFRQAGVTELIAGYCLWLAMFHDTKAIVIISIKDRVAKKVLRKIKYMYRNLPEHIKVKVINGRPKEIGTSTEIEFSNGSIISSVPTTEEAGRSEGLSLLVIDEAAIIRWANTIWASAFPTLSTGGAAIVNSCITGDTVIIGKDKNFRVDSVCPPTKGKMDISHLGLQVLSHTGQWRNVLGSVNKGQLETWEIKDKKGRTLKCTPKHKLLTSSGWMTVKDIISKNRSAIFYDTGLGNLKEPPITIPLDKGVDISKLVLVRKYVDTIYDISVEEDESYMTDSGFVNHNTPYGIGGWFHSEWVKAISGNALFNPIRLKWPMHPERDQAWYDEMASALGPRRTAQEIDGDFLTSGNSVFDLLEIRAIEDSLDEYPIIETAYNDSLLLFNKPQKGKKYFIGADVATGRSRHYSAFTIYDREGEEQGVFKKKIPVGKFASILMKVGRDFNYATLAPESNDIGLATTTKIEEAGYRNLYYATAYLRKKGKKRTETKDIPGWYTTGKNRPVIIDGLEEDIRLDTIITKDPFFVQEAYTFIYDDRNKPVAMGKNTRGGDETDLSDGPDFNDDAILGKAIANQIRKGNIRGSIVLPR